VEVEAKAQALPDKTKVNEKGERVKVGKKGSADPAFADSGKLDYFNYFKQKQSEDSDEIQL